MWEVTVLTLHRLCQIELWLISVTICYNLPREANYICLSIFSSWLPQPLKGRTYVPSLGAQAPSPPSVIVSHIAIFFSPIGCRVLGVSGSFCLLWLHLSHSFAHYMSVEFKQTTAKALFSLLDPPGCILGAHYISWLHMKILPPCHLWGSSRTPTFLTWDIYLLFSLVHTERWIDGCLQKSMILSHKKNGFNKS